MIDELARLAALSPNRSVARLNALVRQTCGRSVSLPPLPAESEADEPLSEAEKVVVEFAEQFSVDVSMISTDQRERLTSALGAETLGGVVLMYIADFVPRVLAGLDALGLTDQLPIKQGGVGSRHRPGLRGIQRVPPSGRAAVHA